MRTAQPNKLDQAYAVARAEFCVQKVDSDDRRWLVKLVGPTGTPYELGIYGVLLNFPKNFPWVPPEITFQTPIWHPNVCPNTGTVEMEALFPQWVMSISVPDVLRRLKDILKNPVLGDVPDETPVDSEGLTVDKVRYQFCHDNSVFKKVAKRWTRKSLDLEPLLPLLCRGERGSTAFTRSNDHSELFLSPGPLISCRANRRFMSVYQPSRPLLI